MSGAPELPADAPPPLSLPQRVERFVGAELTRIWLLAERALRQLQRGGLRAGPEAQTSLEVESILSSRRGGEAPLDAAGLGAALARAEADAVALRAALSSRFAALDLREHELEVALVASATSFDPPLADVFAAIRGPSPGRRGVDLALVAQLLGRRRADRVALLDALEEGRPLIAERLITLLPAGDAFGSPAHRAIQPTPDLLWMLTGRAAPSPSLRSLATSMRDALPFARLMLDEEVRREIDAAGAVLARRTGASAPLFALWGPRGAGKRTVAAALAAKSGRALLALSPSLDAASLLDVARRALRDAAWTDSALYFGPLFEHHLPDEGRDLLALLERATVPVLLGVEARRPPRLRSTRPLAEIALGAPSEPLRLALWREAFGSTPIAPDVDLSRIARGYPLCAGEIHEVAQESIAVAAGGMIEPRTLQSSLSRMLRNELGDLARRLPVVTTWDDVVMTDEEGDRVREFIARKRFEDRVFRDWGIGERVTYGRGLIALFSGPPGTGKTLLAGLIASELGLDLYQVDLSQMFSRWVGETEKQLARVFDAAERAHAVLLFDEADALFAKRSAVEDSRDRYANVTVNYLLQRLEAYRGVAVLTTNKDAYLDEALRRRLTLHLSLEEPEPKERLRLWRKHMPLGVPGASEVDLEALANGYEMTGGYIRNAALRAAFLAAAEGRDLSTELVRHAVVLELEDLGRVVYRPQPSGSDGTDSPNEATSDDYVEG